MKKTNVNCKIISTLILLTICSLTPIFSAELTVFELQDIIHENILAYKDTYDNKKIRLTGFVYSVDEHGDNYAINFETKDLFNISIYCLLNEKSLSKASKLKKGTKVSVEGIAIYSNGMPFRDVTLQDCTLLSANKKD
ncbi:OB-fold protein [Leptospira idonii]|uniref:tRNA_anti-like n=1 Tax=Leptospira idonii TaxID=1193500 RepID=A0A4R9LUV9_9LEPT|nr:hypothetical protein [Leptospira idonii]TGN17784.1 hypothetical protein EHS15_16090 [Leptospira idonii]